MIEKRISCAACYYMYRGTKTHTCKTEAFHDLYHLSTKIKSDEHRAQIVVDSFPLQNRDTIWVKSYPLDTYIFRISVIVAIYMYHNRLEPYNDIL